MSPGTWEAALRSAGRRGFRRRRGRRRAGRQRLRGHPAARPSRRDGDADGLLLLQQRRRRRSPCAGRPRPRARRHRRFDVHHGNGTQDIFWSDRNVMYASTHQMPFYPGTGARSDGANTARSSSPLARRRRRRGFSRGVQRAILPRLDAFAPDLVIVSAGFDGHFRDPLGNLNLREADFAWVTQRCSPSPRSAVAGGSFRCSKAGTISRA